MSSCLFCRIITGELATEILDQDDHAVAFRDINPQAPVHILVVPRRHLVSLAEAQSTDADLLGHLLLLGARVAKAQGVLTSGYRTVINTNRDAGQTVFHLHVHILGGRPFNWPPG